LPPHRTTSNLNASLQQHVVMMERMMLVWFYNAAMEQRNFPFHRSCLQTTMYSFIFFLISLSSNIRFTFSRWPWIRHLRCSRTRTLSSTTLLLKHGEISFFNTWIMTNVQSLQSNRINNCSDNVNDWNFKFLKKLKYYMFNSFSHREILGNFFL